MTGHKAKTRYRGTFRFFLRMDRTQSQNSRLEAFPFLPIEWNDRCRGTFRFMTVWRVERMPKGEFLYENAHAPKWRKRTHPSLHPIWMKMVIALCSI